MLNRDELVKLVQRIMDADGDESEIDHMIQTLRLSVTHPEVVDLIYSSKYPERTAFEIVDIALEFVPDRIAD